jgi:hypothetical protein
MKSSLTNYVNTVPIDIKFVPYDLIVGKAIVNHNNLQMSNNNFFIINGRIPYNRMKKIVIGYIRHNLTNYESIMRKISAKCKDNNKANRACRELKARVNAMICETWRL